MIDQTDREYLREVMATIGNIADESVDLQADMQGDGLNAELRRAAFDGMIDHIIDPPLKMMLKACRIAGITSSQAAQLMAIMQQLQERSDRDAN